MLSESYTGVDAKYLWRCSEGHEWNATYYSIVVNGRWCGKCSGRTLDAKERISLAKKIAKGHRGKCLSTEYVNSTSHLRWECKEGHIWGASISNAQKGKWCPYCAGNKVDAEERIRKAVEYANSRNGECLSSEYSMNKTPMKWRCENGHEWTASYNVVVNRRAWCAICHGTKRNPEKQLEKARDAALVKGGKCLSSSYIKNSDPLIWECERGHKWTAPFYSVVQSGCWCPVCSNGLKERLARHTLEQLFDTSFDKARPQWLVNPTTGKRLELDGYNESLGLAFEYQGEQHSRMVRQFGMTPSRLKSQRKRDAVKRKLCKKQKVTLLEIPHTVDTGDFPRWISESIQSLSRGQSFGSQMNDWRKVQPIYWMESDAFTILSLKDFAAKKGGDCLSKEYKGALEKHKWKCREGHIWFAIWDSVHNSNTWCPVCCGNVVDPVERINLARNAAKSKGGKCLSRKYEKAHAKMLWQCANGHQWESRYNHVVQGGSWCPKCMNKR